MFGDDYDDIEISFHNERLMGYRTSYFNQNLCKLHTYRLFGNYPLPQILSIYKNKDITQDYNCEIIELTLPYSLNDKERNILYDYGFTKRTTETEYIEEYGDVDVSVWGKKLNLLNTEEITLPFLNTVLSGIKQTRKDNENITCRFRTKPLHHEHSLTEILNLQENLYVKDNCDFLQLELPCSRDCTLGEHLVLDKEKFKEKIRRYSYSIWEKELLHGNSLRKWLD